MTPEERVRMNELCAKIQEEKNYEEFASELLELSELIARKHERRFQNQPSLVWHRNRPYKTVPAIVNKIIQTGVARAPEKAEISVIPADYLFREIRIENSLTTSEGATVALKQGARLDLTLEANVKDTVFKSPPVS
jgi:hypothetical protein